MSQLLGKNGRFSCPDDCVLAPGVQPPQEYMIIVAVSIFSLWRRDVVVPDMGREPAESNLEGDWKPTTHETHPNKLNYLISVM